jgi:hypothetical protein
VLARTPRTLKTKLGRKRYGLKKVQGLDCEDKLTFRGFSARNQGPNPNYVLPLFNYPRPISKSKKSIYARPICVFALKSTKSTLWHPCKA